MKDFINGISIFCFAASYGVCLILEVSRLFFRAPIRWIVTAAFAVAGLIAHTIYLWRRAAESVAEGGPPLSSWCDWCLMAAWVLIGLYLYLMIRNTENSQGVFGLPVVLALIGLAWFFRDSRGFADNDAAVSTWSIVHGLALLSGTIVVAVGFIAGVMYLFQSRRLKLKKPVNQYFKMPSLESLQSWSETSFIFSSLLLGIGLLSGLVLNITRQASPEAQIAWSDPVIWSSGVLFLWLLAATIFTLVYKPARRGRKVAYLVVASFLFFSLELGLVLFTQHGSKPEVTVKWVSKRELSETSIFTLPGEGRSERAGRGNASISGDIRIEQTLTLNKPSFLLLWEPTLPGRYASDPPKLGRVKCFRHREALTTIANQWSRA